MKRPLVLFLTLLIAGWILLTGAGKTKDSPLFHTEQLLHQETVNGQWMTVSGYVTKCSVTSSGVRLFINHISIISDSNSKISFLPELQFTTVIRPSGVRPGDQIMIRGRISFWEPAANPGQFDLKSWYFRQNVLFSMKDTQLLNIQKGKMNISKVLYQLQKAMIDSYERIFSDKEAALITAVSLGEKGLMEPEWKLQYQEGGIAHIIAVSGLHITLVGMGIYGVLRKIYVPIWLSAFASGIVTVMYAVMTGNGISAQRAVIMFLIWLGAQICGRKYDQITAVAIAASFVIGQDVQVMKDSSFWLSFSAVLTLIILVPYMQRTCEVQSAVGKSLIGSLGIWIGMLPVTAYFFYQVVPWGILSNLIVIPLMSVVLSMGFAAAAAGIIHNGLGVFTGAPVQYLLKFFDLLCEWQQKLPGSVWVTGCPSWQRIALYYGVLILAAKAIKRLKRMNCKWQIRRKICCLLIWMTVFLTGFIMIKTTGQKELLITCFDVGQGDGAIVQIPGGPVCMIDCGSSSESQIWNYKAGQAVRYYGIQTLDYVFLSHGDKDHISGIEEFLETYECNFAGQNVHGITIKNLVLPFTTDDEAFEKIQMLAEHNKICVMRMDAGANLTDVSGIWSIQCIAPDQKRLTGDSNQDSMVLMLQYGAFRMLFTGDLEGESEALLCEKSDTEKLNADVLKVGHHGTKNGSSQMFLEMVSPKVAVISCGRNNSYGHPHEDTLERLNHCGADVLVTAQHGAVEIISDGRLFRTTVYGEGIF